MTNELNIQERLLFFKEKYFAEKQIFLRSKGRVRFLTIHTSTQIVITGALAASLVWGGVTSYAYLTKDHVLAQKNQTISSMSAQYRTLSSDFSSLEEEVERRAELLENRQAFLEKFLDTDSALEPQIGSADSVADDTPSSSKPTDAEKTSLFSDFFHPAENHATVLPNLDRRRLLLNRLEAASDRQHRLVVQLLAQAETGLKNIEDILAPTAVDVKQMLAQFDGDATAVGGPYIPDQRFDPIFQNGDETKLEELISTKLRLEMVTKALDSFPVGIPAAKYYISSKFGRRRDPLKKTWARHPGLDLAGWPGTAIYATAPGKVVHAGWFGPYGRMVEVEHGNGFKTRYGHMRKLRVKKGDTVTVGTRVGDMGKTGRVTGTHLHYEIWFDGSVRDPAPFLKAGNNVLKIQGNDEKTSD